MLGVEKLTENYYNVGRVVKGQSVIERSRRNGFERKIRTAYGDWYCGSNQ